METIITGDDFAMSSSINEGIARSLVHGHISHTSILANGDAFLEACDLARRHGFCDRVGLHLNLSLGRPLSGAILRSERFCREGAFTAHTRARMLAPLTSAERRLIADEIRAQIARARTFGCAVTHLDSHQHCHISPNLASVVLAVAAESSIRRVRLARNRTPTNVFSRTFKASYNAWVRRRGLTDLRYFGTVDELAGLVPLHGAGEVMVHPIVDADGVVADAASGQPLADFLAPFRQRRP